MIKKIKSNSFFQVVLLLLVSYLLFFLYNNIKLIENRKSIGTYNIPFDNIKYDGFELKNDKLVSVTNEPYIIIDNYNMYFDKLSFNYSTQSNFTWTIEYLEENYAGDYIENYKNGEAISYINKFSENLKINSNYIKLAFKNISAITIRNINIKNKYDYINATLLFFISLAFIPYVYIKNRKFFNSNLHYVFLLLSLSFGLVAIFNFPVALGQSWDDQIHFNNSYDILHKNENLSVAVITDVPRNSFGSINTYEENNLYLKNLNKDAKIKRVRSDNSIGYTKLPYFTMSLASIISKIFNNNFVVYFYCGKLLNLITYITLIFISIKITPKFKHLMTAISLIPTMLFMASNYSYDPFIMGFVTLGLASFMHEYFSEKKVNYKFIAISILSFVIGVSAKPIYIPLLLLLCILKPEKFESKRKYNIFRISIVIITMLVLATFVLPAISGNMSSDPRGGNTSISLQLKSIMASPIKFSLFFFNTISKEIFAKFFSPSSYISFSYNGETSFFVYVFIVLSMITSILLENNEVKKEYKKFSILTFLLVIIIICSIYGALYLTFTPVGLQVINGVQNRYFTPLLFPLLLSIFIIIPLRSNDNNTKTTVLFNIALYIVIYASLYDKLLFLS